MQYLCLKTVSLMFAGTGEGLDVLGADARRLVEMAGMVVTYAMPVMMLT